MKSTLPTATRTLELFEEHHRDYEALLRLTSNFIQRWNSANAADKRAMIFEAPSTCLRHRTTRKWGARLAATVEELARRDGIRIPDWVYDPAWQLTWQWYPLVPGKDPSPRLRAMLRESTPDGFRRRNVFAGRSAIARA